MTIADDNILLNSYSATLYFFNFTILNNIMMKNIQKFLCSLTVVAALNVSAQDKEITVAELPVGAQTFLSKNFADNAVVRAEVDQDFTKKTYEVVLTDGTEVEFDQKGEWREIDAKTQAVPNAFILKEISNYVNTNYSNEKIIKISRERDIEVELGNGIELEFSNTGQFKRIDH